MLEARKDLIKIGITGSYGKTSTKFILAAILGEKYSVLPTPSSFNTPMGLTKVIRTQLEPHHQVFIAEMGARHVGDIKELCDLVRPEYGVLTSVGEQHLETMGNIETIASTKFELIEGLKPGGAAFFGADDGGWCDKLFARARGEKHRAGLGSGYLSMYAEDITVGPSGSRFTLSDGEGGRVTCETKLLGKHNIQNIVLSCAVAKRLGMTMEEIARGVLRAQPVEHRLQLIKGANGVIVIDDAFNANPSGAAAAFEVLGSFPGKARGGDAGPRRAGRKGRGAQLPVRAADGRRGGRGDPRGPEAHHAHREGPDFGGLRREQSAHRLKPRGGTEGDRADRPAGRRDPV